MKKIITASILALLLLIGFVNQSFAQGELVGIEYRNITIAADGLSFSFEVWAYSVEPDYTTAATPWSSFNIKADITLTGGATGIGTMSAANVNYGIAQAGAPSNNPAGGTGPKIGLALSRAGGPELTAAPQRLATVTVPVTGGIVTAATLITTRPSPSAPTGTQTFWNSTISPGTRRPLIVPVPTPLPVTLVSFTAAKESLMALLAWSTTEETQSDRFEIEHSLTGKNWNKIGTVSSYGESKVLRNYTFTDKNPADGENLYRLRMVDTDGTFAYSSIRSLTFENGVETSVYPNPVSDKIFINATDIKSVKIVNASGLQVYQSDKVMNDINVKNFSSGMYLVQVTHTNGLLTTSKIIINK